MLLESFLDLAIKKRFEKPIVCRSELPLLTFIYMQAVKEKKAIHRTSVPKTAGHIMRSSRTRRLERVSLGDSLDQYTDPDETKRSLERALIDVKRGRLHTKL